MSEANQLAIALRPHSNDAQLAQVQMEAQPLQWGLIRMKGTRTCITAMYWSYKLDGKAHHFNSRDDKTQHFYSTIAWIPPQATDIEIWFDVVGGSKVSAWDRKDRKWKKRNGDYYTEKFEFASLAGAELTFYLRGTSLHRAVVGVHDVSRRALPPVPRDDWSYAHVGFPQPNHVVRGTSVYQEYLSAGLQAAVVRYAELVNDAKLQVKNLQERAKFNEKVVAWVFESVDTVCDVFAHKFKGRIDAIKYTCHAIAFGVEFALELLRVTTKEREVIAHIQCQTMGLSQAIVEEGLWKASAGLVQNPIFDPRVDEGSITEVMAKAFETARSALDGDIEKGIQQGLATKSAVEKFWEGLSKGPNSMENLQSTYQNLDSLSALVSASINAVERARQSSALTHRSGGAGQVGVIRPGSSTPVGVSGALPVALGGRA